ncbi:MAG: ribosome silencing factor [Acidobacteriota bacterium]|nr:ribosome silencing factor [Acidobacteriota bacterium]
MTTVVEEKIEQSQTVLPVAKAPVDLSPEDQEILEHVKLAASSAEEKKALDVLVLRLSALTEFTDYFVICSGNSTRQTQAIADEITDQLKKLKVRPLHAEGYNNGEWILIDYGIFVVHVFTEQSRKFYDLERLWRDAERVNI